MGRYLARDVLQAGLARGAPEGGFGPSLDQGLGSSAWMPYCAGRYLEEVPSTPYSVQWYCSWTCPGLALYPGGSAHSGSGGRHGSPSLISQSPKPGLMPLAMSLGRSTRSTMCGGFSAVRYPAARLRSGLETVAEGEKESCCQH